MKTIFCAIHGYTHWEDALVDLINTPEFQRLKSVKQLAAVHHVFPCAVHTRFEHSLGVGHLAEQCALALLRRQPHLKLDPFVLKIAGLCHDLGHGPLSHAYDTFLQKRSGGTHEERSVALLRRIVQRYALRIDSATVDAACELIHPVSRTLPAYMYQIVANDINSVDVDKLDYLCRDSEYTGLRYNIDISRFFEYIRVIDNRLCYSLKRMQYTINNLFMVRHQLHAQVYQHPVVRAIEHMYIDVMKILAPALECDDFVHINDGIFTREYIFLQAALERISPKDATVALLLLHRIRTRDLYKCVDEMRVSSRICRWIDEEHSKMASSNSVFLDCVCIGYQTNPLFEVDFYHKDGSICHLSERDASCVFPFHAQDCMVRFYTTATAWPTA